MYGHIATNSSIRNLYARHYIKKFFANLQILLLDIYLGADLICSFLRFFYRGFFIVATAIRFLLVRSSIVPLLAPIVLPHPSHLYTLPIPQRLLSNDFLFFSIYLAFLAGPDTQPIKAFAAFEGKAIAVQWRCRFRWMRCCSVFFLLGRKKNNKNNKKENSRSLPSPHPAQHTFFNWFEYKQRLEKQQQQQQHEPEPRSMHIIVKYDVCMSPMSCGSVVPGRVQPERCTVQRLWHFMKIDIHLILVLSARLVDVYFMANMAMREMYGWATHAQHTHAIMPHAIELIRRRRQVERPWQCSHAQRESHTCTHTHTHTLEQREPIL